MMRRGECCNTARCYRRLSVFRFVPRCRFIRRQRVLPVIDLASKQEDTLGWQLREMNHLVLPHVKNAVLEAALTVTQVGLAGYGYLPCLPSNQQHPCPALFARTHTASVDVLLLCMGRDWHVSGPSMTSTVLGQALLNETSWGCILL